MAKKPKFTKQGAGYLKRIKERWRKPRGTDSKLRKGRKGKPKKPSPGYGTRREERYFHPSGFKDVLISNPNDLDRINSKEEAVRISHSVGKRKRGIILEKAEKLGIKVLNS